jgi:hypothetical protein
MPLLILILMIVLIAQFGFWETLQAVLGGVAMLILFGALAAALVAAIVRYALRRLF